jgi:hypothetical protein
VGSATGRDPRLPNLDTCVRRANMVVVAKHDDPVPEWVLDREADDGVPTVGMPEPVQEPPNLYLESQPWARYAAHGGLERFAALTVHRARLRREGYEIPSIPWLAIVAVSVSAGLLMAGLIFLADWGWRWMTS